MSRGFVDHCLELLAPLGAVRSRRMFGGHGLYVDGLFVALIALDRFYVKADAETEAHFAAAGCEPFVYEGQAAPVRTRYWTVPDEAMESASLMAPWARLAIQAAMKAAARKAAKTMKAARPTRAIKATSQSTISPPAQPGATPRAPKAKPRAPRRCPPAGPGGRRRRANGRRPGRHRASA